MSIAVELPALGESVHEGMVARWLVQVGDWVEIDQPLVEVTTDKVDAEIPAPSAGRVEKLLAVEGETVPVGGPLVLLNPDADAASPPPAPPPSAQAPADRVASPAAGVEPAAVVPAPRDGDVSATPLAHRVAANQNVELAAVDGTGAAGRVTKEDVLSHARTAAAPSAPADQRHASPASLAPPPQPQEARRKSGPTRADLATYFGYALQPGDEVIPMSPQRKLISAHMVYSKHTSPHVGTVAEVDMSGVAGVRAKHKTKFEAAHDVRLTFLPFIVHATVRALREFPALNASVLDEAIVQKKDIHIGMAVETEKGLVVPVIRNADRLSLSGLATAIDDISSRARSKRLSPDELRGGSFTISNPGRQGNLYGFAIINQPQVGILRMGEMVKRPVVRSIDGEDAIIIRRMMYLALSYDHRAVDGAPANGFLFRVRELLEAADFDL